MSVTPESLRADLAGLSRDAVRADLSARRIVEAAEERRRAVGAEMDAAAEAVQTDDDAAERYQSLVLERGRLDLVAAREPRPEG